MISPTQYTLHQRCPRAWWYKYVGRLPTPTTAALTNGSAVHAAVEEYLTRGLFPTSDAPAVAQARRAGGVLATAAMRYVGAWSAIEAPVDLDLAPWGGVDRLGGRVDWHGVTPEGTPWVLDHKTTASPDHWLTPERLATDPQLLAYAGGLFPDTAGPVTVGHVYIPPAPIEPALVTGEARREDIDATLAKYAAATVAMAALRALPVAEAVEARTEGCWAYGGCSYAVVCSAAPEALRRRMQSKEESPMSTTPVSPAQAALLARLGLPGGTTTPAPVAAPTTPPPAPEPAPATTTLDRALAAAALREQGAPPEVTDKVAADALDDGLTEAGRAALVGATPPATAAPALVPPDAPKRTRKSRATSPAAAGDDGGPSPGGPGGPGGPVVTGAALAGAHRVDPAAVEARHVEAGLVPVGDPVVYVGCATSRPATTLEEWAADALAAATRDDKGTDYGHYLLVPFGHGPRVLAATLAADLNTGRRTLPRRLVLPADHPVAPFLVPALARHAEIVRGVR